MKKPRKSIILASLLFAVSFCATYAGTPNTVIRLPVAPTDSCYQVFGPGTVDMLVGDILEIDFFVPSSCTLGSLNASTSDSDVLRKLSHGVHILNDVSSDTDGQHFTILFKAMEKGRCDISLVADQSEFSWQIRVFK